MFSIDFSLQSLLLNKQTLAEHESQLLIRADLNQTTFTRNHCGVVIMTDFLQHLGDWEAQKAFLQKAADALKVGGRFYLSLFNMNIKHYLRGDIHGSFSGGQIPYCRTHHKELCRLLPKELEIEQLYPMNIFHSPSLDNLARKVPGAFFLGRMLVVTGQRI